MTPVRGHEAKESEHWMRSVTIRQCVVLVGGGSALQPCGDRPLISWKLREFIRFGVEEFVLLTGDHVAAVEAGLAALAARLPRQARIVVSQAPTRAGTGGALFAARERLDERFLLCDGDSLFNGSLAPLLSAAAGDGSDVVCRMVLRRSERASRHGVVALDGDRVCAYRAPHPDALGVIDAGVCLFARRLVEELESICSLELDILPRLAAQGALRGAIGEGYYCDAAVPEDFARAQEELPRRLHRPALLLDRDGVVNVDHGWVGTRERFQWTPGAREAIRAATDAGWHVFIVTNQSGVARGHFDEAAVMALHAWMTDEVRRAGGTIDDIRYCPFHEDAVVPAYRRVSDWRKPAPGMLLDLIRVWELDRARCVMVGDQDRDMAAAKAAGVRACRFDGGDLADFVRPILGGV
jgi:D-glycero-D-manno-heptose 1,7-bisphosphate phosphatase